jgi:hypothetical protein
MTANQGGEGVVIAMTKEGAQQLLVALLAARVGQQTAKATDAGLHCGTIHDGGSQIRKCCHLLIVPGRHTFGNEISLPRFSPPTNPERQRRVTAPVAGAPG